MEIHEKNPPTEYYYRDNSEKQSRQLVETWIHRVFLIVVGLIAFFLQDTLGQVRTQMKATDQKVELLENILIEVRTSNRKDSERYTEIQKAIDKLDDKIEALRR